MDWKNNIKMAVLPKLTHRFQCNTHQNSNCPFTKMDKADLKIHMEIKSPQSLKKTLNKVERLTLDDFKAYCKTVIVNQDAVVMRLGWTYRSMEQDWSSKLNPWVYGQLIFDEDARSIQWEKKCSFGKWYWDNWTASS